MSNLTLGYIKEHVGGYVSGFVSLLVLRRSIFFDVDKEFLTHAVVVLASLSLF